MPDYGQIEADKAVDQLARKIRATYRNTGDDLQKKFDAFLKKHKAKGEEMLKKLANGEITQAEYHSWMRSQVFIGKQWEQKIESVMNVMNTANEKAVKVISERKLGVFAENYNRTAYDIDKDVDFTSSLDLYNETAVAKLLKENPKLLPEWKINKIKDYAWNRQKVENAITQGIIQGEGIGDIVKRLINDLITTNVNRMRTFVRTAITGAQNAARQQVMDDAEKDGIEVRKMWVASLDSRTRDAHRELDGQIVDKGKPFYVDLGTKKDGTKRDGHIMYPGDPNADPSNVYNCRCRLNYVLPDYEKKGQRRAYREWVDENGKKRKESYIIDYMTYKEWEEWKKKNGK